MNPDQDLLDYCRTFSSPVQPVLQALERATHLKTLQPQMMAGPYQGLLLQMLSWMIRPRRILEIGAFTGYSSICLAQGLPDDGHLHTIEVNDELSSLFHTYVIKAGFQDKITLHTGDAAQIIPGLEEAFDLILLDAGKMDYPLHYELALPKLRPGGFLLADNVLWNGKVVSDFKDATAAVLRQFNQQVLEDPRVQSLILPLRDGLMLVRKHDI